MDVLGFSEAEPGASVVEIGTGTGNFLVLFSEVASILVGVDLTPSMLLEARKLHGITALLVADGANLPLKDKSFSIVACAQMLHHVPEPGPLLREMGRVAEGRVLVVDQVSTEDPAEIAAMNELEILRDPSHAASRSPSELRRLLADAGLEVIKERGLEISNTFSNWMAREEFPDKRIESVLRFIEQRGEETGMDFREEGGELVFTRRRMMLLAHPV